MLLSVQVAPEHAEEGGRGDGVRDGEAGARKESSHSGVEEDS